MDKVDEDVESYILKSCLTGSRLKLRPGSVVPPIAEFKSLIAGGAFGGRHFFGGYREYLAWSGRVD